ncbi:hypothetical protein Tco_0191744 [Tanacetum coccineum]
MEVFIGGLPRSIKGNVTPSKPQTLEEAINIAQRLMDQETFKTNGNYDINALIPGVGSVHCITQDLALSGVRIVTK